MFFPLLFQLYEKHSSMYQDNRIFIFKNLLLSLDMSTMVGCYLKASIIENLLRIFNMFHDCMLMVYLFIEVNIFYFISIMLIRFLVIFKSLLPRFIDNNINL